jgi:hypothetical protein
VCPPEKGDPKVRLIKMFGLAAIAAVAAMAFIGASSASATVLCTQNIEPCEGGHETEEMYGETDTIKGKALNPRLTSDLSNVKCANSETTAEVETTGGAEESVTGTVTALNFNECKTEQLVPVNCTVTVNNIPYHTELHAEGGGNGMLTVTGVTEDPAENPGATVVCAGVINCTFSKPLFELPVTGGNPASITASKVSLSRTGGTCGNEAFWDATYVSTTPAWVVHE